MATRAHPRQGASMTADVPRPPDPGPVQVIDIETSRYYYVSMETTAILNRAPLDARVILDAAEMIRVLGHPVRLRIVECLEAGELTVTELQDALAAPQAAVSQQLARMRAAGIVSGRRDGVHVRYSIADARVVQMLNCLRNCNVPIARGRQRGTR